MARGEEYKRHGGVFIGQEPKIGNYLPRPARCWRVNAPEACQASVKNSQVLGFGSCKYHTVLNPQLYFTLNLNINHSKVYQLN